MKQVSILLATFRRSDILAQSLTAMASMDAQKLDWEVIVVDNAGEEATRQVCQSFQDRLPLRYLVCTKPGKSAALNQGLREVDGELIVLTDDDVLPEAGWLRAMWQGTSRWPNHVLFGGRVLPHWPAEPPAYALNPSWDRWTFGVYDPGLPEGPSPSSYPVGVNFAVRRSVFREKTAFNEHIGPNGSSYAMGNETDFFLQLGRKGHQPVFLPGSLVYHIIRPEQVNRDWLIGRAFRQGRGESRLNGEVSWYSVARLMKNAIWRTGAYYGAFVRRGRTGAFPKRMACSLSRGRLYEALHQKLKGQ